jgi:hypothetical protein
MTSYPMLANRVEEYREEVAGLFVSNEDPEKDFQTYNYDNRPELKPEVLGGNKFSLETILQDGKLVTFVGILKDKTGRRDYTLIGKLPFDFKPQRKRPTKPTTDFSRIEVNLIHHRTNPNIYGVCQFFRVQPNTPKDRISRYIGVVRLKQ